MKTVELSAALGQAQVVENLKNFVGVDAQGAAALMTPERLAAVAGGMIEVRETFNVATRMSLVYIGDFKKSDSKTYEFMTFHYDGVQELYAIITIGMYSDNGLKVCKVHNFYGTLKVFNLKGSDKLYIEIPRFRLLKYRLLYGNDIVHNVIELDDSQLASEYEQIQPSLV